MISNQMKYGTVIDTSAHVTGPLLPLPGSDRVSHRLVYCAVHGLRVAHDSRDARPHWGRALYTSYCTTQ